MNSCHFIGNLVKDPQVVNCSSGTSCCKLSIAVQRKFADANGEKATDFINCTAWGKTADLCIRYLLKGNKVMLGGELRQNNYKDKNGENRTTYDLNVNEVEFLTPKKQNEVAETTATTTFTDVPFNETDLPF